MWSYHNDNTPATPVNYSSLSGYLSAFFSRRYPSIDIDMYRCKPDSVMGNKGVRISIQPGGEPRDCPLSPSTAQSWCLPWTAQLTHIAIYYNKLYQNAYIYFNFEKIAVDLNTYKDRVP